MTTYLPDERLGQAGRSNAAALPRLVCEELLVALLDPGRPLLDWLLGFSLDMLDGQHGEIRALLALSDRLVVALLHHIYPLFERAHCEVL